MTNTYLQTLAPNWTEPPPGEPESWRRFFSFSTDHKVIGIQYIVTAFIFFLVGGFLAMVMRGEL
ncbi:MAG: cytochrome c oxidase subunit I, partial [Nodosilinea sp.]